MVKEKVLSQPREQVTLLRRSLVYLLLTTAGFAQPLLGLYGSNIAVFTTAGFEGAIIVWFGLMVLLVPTAVFVLADVSLSFVLRRHADEVHLAIIGVALCVVFSSILRSVSLGTWWLDVAMISLIAGVTAWMYARIGVVSTWLVAMSPLALAVFVIFVVSASSVITPPSVGRASTSNDAGSAVRQDASVLWILLDEAPLWPLLSKDGSINARRFPGFAALADSSTWYRNAMTPTQLTVNAVPSILSGQSPRFGRQPVFADYPKNLFTAFNGEKRIDASEEVTALCPKTVCVEPRGAGWEDVADIQIVQRMQRVSFQSFLKDALVVAGHQTLPQDLRARLPAIDDAWGGFSNSGNQTSSTGEIQGDAGVIERIQRLQSLIDRAVVSTEPTVHFTHVLLPHRPWALTPEMRIAPTPLPDNRPGTSVERKKDTYQSLLRQYAAVDTIIGDMVTKLRQSENWDRTMVIVTADHGATFVPGESIRNTINPDNMGTLHDIFRVPLFVKYPNQTNFASNDCAANSIDILPTAFGVAGVNPGWATDGKDLRTDCGNSTKQKVQWPEGSADIGTSFSELQKRVTYYDKWVDSNGDVASIIKSGRSGSLVGTRTPEFFSQSSSLSWSLDKKKWYQNVGEGLYSMVPNRATGRLKTTAKVPSTTDGLIVIDGVVSGVVSEVASLTPTNKGAYFASVLLSETISAGSHDVELWTVDWSGGAPMFERVGPPQ